MEIQQATRAVSLLLGMCLVSECVVGLQTSAKGSGDSRPAACYWNEDKYQSQKHCQPDAIELFKKAGEVSRNDRSLCTVLDDGRIDCNVELTCSGERKYDQVKVEKNITAIYNCNDGNQNSVLVIPCCAQCRDLQKSPVPIKGELPTRVECKGCEEADLEKIAKENLKICKRNDATGEYFCNLKENHRTGAPNISTSTEKYECLVTPCGSCATPFAKAQCCQQCLQDTCRSGSWRPELKKVCTGCSLWDAQEAILMWQIKEKTGLSPSTQRIAAGIVATVLVLLLVAMFIFFWRRGGCFCEAGCSCCYLKRLALEESSIPQR